MKLLYITNGFPFPLTSGYLRHYFLIRELAEEHDITLLSLVRPSYRPEHAEAMRPWLKELHVFASAPKSTAVMRRSWQRLQPHLGGEDAPRRMAATAGKLVAKGDFDVVLFSGKQTFPVIKQIGDLPMVVDMCDATSLRIRDTIRFTSARKRPLLWAKYLRLRYVERQLMRRAAHLLFASCRDRDCLLDRAAGKRATVIPNGVDVGYWRRSYPPALSRTVVFTGAMDYPPNADAAHQLIGTIFPRLRQRIPDARLLIVGRDPGPALIQAGQQDGVTVTGLGDDMRPYLEQAAVFAAPLRFGAGIQNKVLEALAMQVPVVASEVAAGGLRTQDGLSPPLEVAEGPDQFADLLAERLAGAPTTLDEGSRLRDFVEQNFAWNASGESLRRVLMSVVDPQPSHVMACSP